jgi:hypothetical protein
MHAQSTFGADDSALNPDARPHLRFRFPYRPFESSGSLAGSMGLGCGFTISLTADTPIPDKPVPGTKLRDAVGLRAVAPFLADAAYGMVPAATLARMIGRYCFTGEGMADTEAIVVSLTCPDGKHATALVERPEF